MSQLLHLRSISHEIPSFSQLLSDAGFESLSVRSLTPDSLTGRAVILIEAHIDQRCLMDWRAGLEAHLDAGGLLVFNGHLAYPLINGVGLFQVAAGRDKASLVVERQEEHPVFSGVDCQDLSMRRGVAGFYARGANPPPEGA